MYFKNVLVANFAVKYCSKPFLMQTTFSWSDEFIYINKLQLETSQPCKIDSCYT